MTRSHACDCGCAFPTAARLLRHAASHTAKQHQCCVCGRWLSRVDHLNKHLRSHTGAAVYDPEEDTSRAEMDRLLTFMHADGTPVLGCVLDPCGAHDTALQAALTNAGCRVICNDLSRPASHAIDIRQARSVTRLVRQVAPFAIITALPDVDHPVRLARTLLKTPTPLVALRLPRTFDVDDIEDEFPLTHELPLPRRSESHPTESWFVWMRAPEHESARD